MFELLIARSDPMADASLPAIRARSRPGTAIAAMIPMMATTISSSISVKPLVLRILITSPRDGRAVKQLSVTAWLPPSRARLEQPAYRADVFGLAPSIGFRMKHLGRKRVLPVSQVQGNFDKFCHC